MIITDFAIFPSLFGVQAQVKPGKPEPLTEPLKRTAFEIPNPATAKTTSHKNRVRHRILLKNMNQTNNNTRLTAIVSALYMIRRMTGSSGYCDKVMMAATANSTVATGIHPRCEEDLVAFMNHSYNESFKSATIFY